MVPLIVAFVEKYFKVGKARGVALRARGTKFTGTRLLLVTGRNRFSLLSNPVPFNDGRRQQQMVESPPSGYYVRCTPRRQMDGAKAVCHICELLALLKQRMGA
ncbi:hypothetical protein TNCV_1897331 [Trichonephila clavipes]|nr:hypothetical protein TNCV_1897331 [Trichonephila clavipes]